MRFKLKTNSEVVDEETGVIVAARGFAELGQTSFAFFDPKSDATSYRDDRYFYVIGDMIYDAEPIDPAKSKRKKFVGYRFGAGALAGHLRDYHKGDVERLAFAKKCIAEGVRVYLQEYAHLANPIVEIVPEAR